MSSFFVKALAAASDIPLSSLRVSLLVAQIYSSHLVQLAVSDDRLSYPHAVLTVRVSCLLLLLLVLLVACECWAASRLVSWSVVWLLASWRFLLVCFCCTWAPSVFAVVPARSAHGPCGASSRAACSALVHLSDLRAIDSYSLSRSAPPPGLIRVRSESRACWRHYLLPLSALLCRWMLSLSWLCRVQPGTLRRYQPPSLPNTVLLVGIPA